MTDPELSHELVRHDKDFMRMLVDKYANPILNPPTDNPVTYFMAGAPGSGKTEWAAEIVELYRNRKEPFHFVHIDPDKIREEFPGYNGLNVDDYQRATSLAVGRLIDKTHKARQDVIVDGTLSSHSVADQNIDDCINRYKRSTAIFYVYQKPELAWLYTKARLIKEGRPVSKDAFINAYIKSIDNANAFKAKYGRGLLLYVIEKNQFNGLKKSPFKVEKIDNNVEKVYSRKELERIITE